MALETVRILQMLKVTLWGWILHFFPSFYSVTEFYSAAQKSHYVIAEVPHSLNENLQNWFLQMTFKNANQPKERFKLQIWPHVSLYLVDSSQEFLVGAACWIQSWKIKAENRFNCDYQCCCWIALFIVIFAQCHSWTFIISIFSYSGSACQLQAGLRNVNKGSKWFLTRCSQRPINMCFCW